jgi:WD40 repeat protein
MVCRFLAAGHVGFSDAGARHVCAGRRCDPDLPHPPRSRIATGGGDGTVRLFDTATGNAQLVLAAHTNLVSAVAFSPDGTRLASASADGLVRVWALDLDDLITIARQEVTRGLTAVECRRYLHGPCGDES